METTGNNNNRLLGIKINSRYEILKKIAAGGMADVYLGQDLKLGKKVAIKILHETYSSNKNFISRFKREAQILSNLNNKNIVSVYNWGEFSGFYYIVMEFVSGLSLKELIEKRGALSAETAVKYCLQICNALTLAHANNLIHRDIKPQNIMITKDGFIKVADFGIAKSTVDDLTKTMSVFGTAHYVSPEQVQGKVLDSRADIYSLGIVMYEMITADVPFRGGSSIDISLRHINEKAQPPSKIIPQIPAVLEKIVMKCLEKNPGDRYASIEYLKNDLQNFLAGKPIAADRPLKNGNIKTDITARLKNYFERDSQLEKTFKKYDVVHKRTRAILILSTSAFFIISVIFLILFLLLNIRVNNMVAEAQNITLPDMTGTELESAKSLVWQYGLSIEIDKSIYDDSIPPDHIISQRPAAGTKVKKETTIYVTVSKAKEITMITVPDVTGLNISDALEKIKSSGLSQGSITEEFSDTIEKNMIKEQKPLAGSSVEQNTEIDLKISKGAQLITIPDIKGYDYSFAKLNLESLGLFAEFKRRTDLNVQPGIVIAIEPVEGSQVYKNSVVTVYISTGQSLFTVPDLTGMDFEKAIQILSDTEIEYEVSYIKVDYSIQRGSIIAQFPLPGDAILQNEKIILFVGQ